MASKHCTIEELKPGMLLAQPILDDKGRTVVPEGSRLTPMHIKRLSKWGVESVTIILDDSNASQSGRHRSVAKTVLTSASEEERDRMRFIAESIQERFSDVDKDEIMSELKRLAVRHLILGSQNKAIPGTEI
jgi:hypothetical protein